MNAVSVRFTKDSKMETVHNQHWRLVENNEREAEARALESFESDLGLNDDTAFGGCPGGLHR
jgi:hypothetical protein